ncbi:uncharacterized protein LOC112091775 [Morus notabilis]|uniref:uncharacterized protein LOC112091775 n=1 Tax=Morus notabilis TaxID=981085 RepID=UPI000CED2F0D|nr:uncharacterized protein LOC112091775 [Morus notabilis]
MEKIESDMKISELKQVSLCKAYEALHSEASTVLLLTLQWKDLDEHFNTTRNSLREKFEELLEREKSENRRELEVAVKKKLATQESVAERQKELDKVKKEIKDRAKKLDSLERSVRQRSEEFESKGKELNSVRGTLKKCREDLDCKERQLYSIRRSLEDNRKEVELIDDQLKKSRNSIHDCDLEIKLREQRLQAIQDSTAERSIELEMKEKELDLLCKDLELERKMFVSLKKSVEQCTSGFDAKERKFEALMKALQVKETSSESKIEELGLTHKRVNECLKELELKEKNFASLQRQVEERFHELEKREKQFEATKKEFDSIRNTLAFRSMVKTKAPNSHVKIEQSDNDQNSGDFPSLASNQSCITNGHSLQVLLSEQLKKQESLCTDIYTVLQRSPDPAKLVLDAIQGFFPSHSSAANTSLDLGIVRSGCILLLEQLMKASPPISPQVREEAMKLAGDWKAKMTLNAPNVLEVLGFVRLLASYGLASAFDADEVRSLLDVVSANGQASELRRTLCVADKVPVDIGQAENSRAIANIATSSPNHHSSTNPSGRNPELVEHEDLIGKSLTQDDIIAALQMPDPAKHVLGVVEGSFSQLWKRGDVGFEACFMKSYIFMFENLLRNLPLIQPHIREDAMKVANQWRKRMREDTENPLEVLGFLQFLAVYGLVSSFNEYDISGFLEMISRHKHALELSGSLRVAYEIPEFIANFLKRKRNIEAVRLSFAFILTDKFSPTKLLTEHMEDAKSYTRQFCDRKYSIEEKDEITDREIAALRDVVQCIKDCDLESQFQFENILKRISLLEKIKDDRKHSALFFQSSNEQQLQQTCNKRRNGTLSPLDLPLQQSKKNCLRKPLSTAKHRDRPAPIPVSQHTNCLSKLHGTVLAAGKRNVVLGATSGAWQVW